MATVTPIREEIGAIAPKWIQIPAAVRRSSICRSKLYALIRRGAVRSACLRDEDNVRGTRLINVASLDAYIDKHVDVWSEAPDKVTGVNGGGH